MYEQYLNYISANIDKVEMSDFPFKRNDSYSYMLEHVTQELGRQYLDFIEKEFKNIPETNIEEFVKINDKFGSPQFCHYKLHSGKDLTTSPTTLRYIYHALLILKHYQETASTKSMVEVGCGYGGLFLAICYFANCLNITIDKYYLIDFPQIGQLIDKYLKQQDQVVTIPYEIHDCFDYGIGIHDTNLFFISNYCFTEISEDKRQLYVAKLLNKTKHGFIIWQADCSLDRTSILNKRILNIVEEKPQTSLVPGRENHFVTF